MTTQTIIIGGGIAGMSCALTLMQAPREFLLITDALGGRIRYSKQAGMNFGAYFVMNTYHHALNIVKKETLLNPLQVCFHNSPTENFSALNFRTLRLSPEFLRFYFAMREFASHYEPYKQRCLTIPQQAALQADPYMADLFAKPAAQFIREKDFGQVASDYVSKFSYACTGIDVDCLTALDFLNVSMGLLVPIHRFRFEEQALAQRLGNHLVKDTILEIKSRDGVQILRGASGETYAAENIVVATPAAVTKNLLGLQEIRASSKIFVYHVKAELKPIYRKYVINLFPPGSKIMLTVREHDGSYLIYSRETDIDLHDVCDTFELMETVAWDHAMYVHGRAFMEQQYGDSVFTAGDHNGLGLEPAAISGIYAANQIIYKTAAGKN